MSRRSRKCSIVYEPRRDHHGRPDCGALSLSIHVISKRTTFSQPFPPASDRPAHQRALIIFQISALYKPGIERVQAYVLANILRWLFVARTPSEEARSQGRRSNVENVPRRRPITGEPATPTSHIRRTILRTSPRHPPASGQQRAQTPPSRPFALCRHIAGWTQACN